MRSKLVSPSILSADFANLEKEVKAVLAAGADWIHVDVMDGHFVPNLTIGAPVVKSLRKVSSGFLDCHLMVEKPDTYLDAFCEAGANLITLHIEALRDPKRTLRRVRELGMKPGITMKPQTPIEEVFGVLDEVDLVLIMTVEPGFSGQTFMTDQVAKIHKLRDQFGKKGLSPLIQVDGGVNQDTLHHLQDADVLVAGNFIFKSPDYRAAIAQLKTST